MLRVSIPKGMQVSTFFLGLYFILLPFDFYRVAGMGSVSRIAAYLPLGFCILERIHADRNIRIRLNGITKSAFLFLFITAISALLSISLRTSRAAYMTLVMNMAMVILLGGCRPYGNEEIKWLERCLILSGWLTGFLMIAFSDFSFNRMIFSIGDSRQDPNYICGFMLYAFCCQMKHIVEEKKIIHVLMAGTMTVLVILTGSRGALLAYAVAAAASVIVYGNLKPSTKKKKMGGVVLVFLGALFLYNFVLPKLNPAITERFTVDYFIKHGTTGRTDIWLYLLNKYKNAGIFRHIIGFGYGTSALLNDMPAHSRDHVAHNLYIDNLVCAGLLGLAAQLIFQFNCFKTAVKSGRKTAVCTYAAYIAMCLSLSLTSYKPIWALVIMLLIYERSGSEEAETAVD